MNKEDFLKDFSNFDNHRVLLWPALEKTVGPVVEMGMGQGSTPYLHEYCKDAGRELFSFDHDIKWAAKFEDFCTYIHHIASVTQWDLVYNTISKASVVLIDHAPGERRKIDIERWNGSCDFLIAHDTEPAAEKGYQMRPSLEKFKYLKDYKTEGAWSTIVSNLHELT